MKSETEPIGRNTVRFMLEKKSRLEKIIEVLARTQCSYYDYETGGTKRAKDALDFVSLGTTGLTMREVQKYLEVI